MLYQALSNLLFISSNASCCSSSQINILPFLVKSYIGLSNICNSRQNILRKLMIPVKLLQPFSVVGGFNFNMVSTLFLNGLTQTFLSFINMMLPINCSSVLNNWHFLRDILSPFFSNAFNKSSNLDKCTLFVGVNNNKSSLIASQYFLLYKLSKIPFIYDCHMEGKMFNLIGIL